MTTTKEVRQMLLSLSDDNLASVLELWANSVSCVAGSDVGNYAMSQIGYLVSAVGSDKLYGSVGDFRRVEPEADVEWVGPINGVHGMLIEGMSLERFESSIMALAKEAFAMLTLDGKRVSSDDQTGAWHEALCNLIERRRLS